MNRLEHRHSRTVSTTTLAGLFFLTATMAVVACAKAGADSGIEASSTTSNWSSGQGASGGAGQGGTGTAGDGGAASASSSSTGGADVASVLVLASGTSNSLLGRYSPNAEWQITTDSTTSTAGSAIAMSDSQSGLAVLRRDSDNRLVGFRFSSGTFEAPVPLGPSVTSRAAPSMAYDGAAFHMVFHGDDYKHYYGQFDAGGWSSTSDPVAPDGGGQSYGPSQPHLTMSGDGPLALFQGDDQQLYLQLRSQDKWQTAEPLAEATTANPPVAVKLGASSKLLAVYIEHAPTTSNHFKLRWSIREGATWTSPKNIGAAVFTETPPALLALSDSKALIAYLGTDGRGYSCVYDADESPTWSSPKPIDENGAPWASAPSLAPGVTGAQAELAAIAGGAAVHHRLVNGSWSAPVAIGGVNLKHIAIASSP